MVVGGLGFVGELELPAQGHVGEVVSAEDGIGCAGGEVEGFWVGSVEGAAAAVGVEGAVAHFDAGKGVATGYAFDVGAEEAVVEADRGCAGPEFHGAGPDGFGLLVVFLLLIWGVVEAGGLGAAFPEGADADELWGGLGDEAAAEIGGEIAGLFAAIEKVVPADLSVGGVGDKAEIGGAFGGFVKCGVGDAVGDEAAAVGVLLVGFGAAAK